MRPTSRPATCVPNRLTGPLAGMLATLLAATLAAAVAGCSGGSQTGIPTSFTPTTNARSSAGIQISPGAATTGPSSIGSPTSATGAAPPTPPDETVSPSGTPNPAPTSTAAVHGDGGLTHQAAILSAIRGSDHTTSDRLVLEFSGAFGGYDVKYTPSVVEDPSGAAVSLRGAAFLQVTIQGATLDNTFQAGGSVALRKYAGPKRMTLDLPNLKDVASAGDFEAVLSFGLGVGHTAGFSVMRLTAPARLVIDIAH